MAIRAGWLKNILKSQQELMLIHVGIDDRIKIQWEWEKERREKERQERLQHKDNGRVEGRIRANQAHSQMTAGAWQMQRERNREAARISLQKMEKTVAFEDNLLIGKYFESLSVFDSTRPLELFGLFLKKDDFYDDEEAEAGEILE
ncbi:transcription factor GTE10-like [Cornus florida]|uniref:transcription factor GTE10-like n=1 Tax=Cornus florida TaxID=4283 RepID=UPI00289BA656|nr:transcription factor GTE10-like [Cornus florida]XP_059637241.1 transcription factor GTE10-like [Cornus florida]XP_059637260.1 transcription factor GTE10-like [Cornus florida]XP_059637261.1 transcription factor GTE10-like [Cornus florida]